MSHYYLNFDDWYLWQDSTEEEQPCQIPLYVDLEPPHLTPEDKEEGLESPRVIIIDI